MQCDTYALKSQGTKSKKKKTKKVTYCIHGEMYELLAKIITIELWRKLHIITLDNSKMDPRY